MKKWRAMLIATVLLLMVSCTSTQQGVYVDTTPTNVGFFILNSKDEIIESSLTPALITLNRNSAVFVKEKYKFNFFKSGYKNLEVEVPPNVDILDFTLIPNK
jgi:uncharacterized protein YcfL